MKKKFSKERFYKRLEAKKRIVLLPALFAQECAEWMINQNKIQAMQRHLLDIKANIQHLKEHGVLREKSMEYVTHSNECKITPEQIAEFKNFVSSKHT
ncbi:hypothetical protein G9F32_03135 [Acinetobacter sp. 194]|uniref:hypothetical protein n=1 Tax=Acinetobacter shaoyimingii TaxID=2715164 RepID=UPI00140E85C3|nr:hypothetical protein [Acinetobacter shaoyimingii]NHB57027.1 hypothetical protein [Acinetobacter shaoyimingii]